MLFSSCLGTGLDREHEIIKDRYPLVLQIPLGEGEKAVHNYFTPMCYKTSKSRCCECSRTTKNRLRREKAREERDGDGKSSCQVFGFHTVASVLCGI